VIEVVRSVIWFKCVKCNYVFCVSVGQVESPKCGSKELIKIC